MSVSVSVRAGTLTPSALSSTAPASERDHTVGDWHLVHRSADGQYTPYYLHHFPFRIGRQADNDLRLTLPEASRYHAEIQQHNGRLWLRDCGSTNGTFVNGQRVLQAAMLNVGDALFFGPQEFHLQQSESTAPATTPAEPVALDPDMTQPGRALSHQQRFQDMLRRRSVTPLFQPVQDLQSGHLIGYEILGRCDYAGLPRRPLQALAQASDDAQQTQLSDLFREVGMSQAERLGNRRRLFLNAAPCEIEPLRLAASLTTLRRRAPDLPLVLEVNENTAAGLGAMRELHALLTDLNIELAYDDFGVGQARFIEIIEYPPDWLKFDLSLIHSIRNRFTKTRQVLQSLLSLARDVGARTVAEGIETQADLDACRLLGFDAGQGFLLGRPQPFLADD